MLFNRIRSRTILLNDRISQVGRDLRAHPFQPITEPHPINYTMAIKDNTRSNHPALELAVLPAGEKKSDKKEQRVQRHRIDCRGSGKARSRGYVGCWSSGSIRAGVHCTPSRARLIRILTAFGLNQLALG